MSSKQRSKKTQPTGESQAPEARAAGRGPSTLAIGIAILGLGALVVALVVTGDPPERRRRTVAVASYVDRWNAAPAQDVGVAPGGDFSLGPEDAPVTIVTFSDFECPYCKDASATLADAYDRYQGDVRIVFKNYPLDQSCNAYMPRSNHLYSCRAAAMARCAGSQDRFWEMHDAIFGLRQINLTTLDALPGELGLSADAFAACMQDEQVQQQVKGDIEEGKRLGVDGTPTIFVNGRKAPSPTPEAIDAIVEHLLSGTSASSSSGGSGGR